MVKQPQWFWAHRRNASLHHFSFLMHGLRGKGWRPVVNFSFDNQIVVGVPGKGCYVFYDKNQLSSSGVYKDVQESIDKATDFVSAFRRRTDEVFGAIFFKCNNIDLENLILLTDKDLGKMYEDFMDTIMATPIITVQLWGIEALLDENYKISQFLHERLTKLGKTREYEIYKGLLTINTGETVAFTEQKNFFQVAQTLWENEEVRKIFFSGDSELVSERLENFTKENQLFENHTKKYAWVNTEYVSGGWSRIQWVELFQKALQDSVTPKEKLEELLENFQELNQQRDKALAELQPPADVQRAIDALAEFIAQRDWTKGYFTRILLSYHTLLHEIAQRLDIKDATDLFLYSYQELSVALENTQAFPQTEIESRKKDGFMIVIKEGEFSLITGKENIQKEIEEEGVSEPFEKIIFVDEFKGIAASRGSITARARVLEDASRIHELEEGEILVTYMTTIEFIPAFRKAAAVITDEGGLSCHAAIISREFKLPCIVGTKVATRVIKTGDLVEVDADNGVVRILK